MYFIIQGQFCIFLIPSWGTKQVIPFVLYSASYSQLRPGSVQFSFYILLSVPCQVQHGSLSILFSRLEDVVIGSSCCSHELCLAMTMSLESDSDWCSDTVCMKPSLQFNCPLRISTLIFYTGSILQKFWIAKSLIARRSFFICMARLVFSDHCFQS